MFVLLFYIDLELSEAQKEHILAIEHLVPELTDLKNELCPSCMAEGRFWTIYFLLIFPTLDKDEAELLSSPQVVSTFLKTAKFTPYHWNFIIEVMSIVKFI